MLYIYMSFNKKYLKYKNKYLELKKQIAGSTSNLNLIPIFKGKFSISIFESSEELYKDFIDYYEDTIQKHIFYSGLDANIEKNDQSSYTYITVTIKNVTIEELKKILTDFEDKKGIQLTKDNGAYMYLNYDKILNINDLNKY